MNSQDRELELQRQAAADQAERQGTPAGDGPVDAYRLVARAVRAAPLPALPADFARRVAARARVVHESASVEEWLTTLLMLGFCGGAAVFLLPSLAPLLQALHPSLPGVPWPMVFATAVALGLAWAMDRGWGRWPHP